MQCFRQALVDWSCLTKIRWTLSDQPQSIFNIQDAICTVRFADINTSSTIAETEVYVRRCFGSPGGITELGVNVSFDMKFEPQPDGNSWFYDASGELNQPADSYDFYALALHELGHAHLLQHVIDEQDIMHGLNSTYHPSNVIPSNVRRTSFVQGNADGGNEIVLESNGLDFQYCTQIEQFSGQNPHQHDLLVIENCDLGLSTQRWSNESTELCAFPNPTWDEFHFVLPNGFKGNYRLKLYDTLGSQVFARELEVKAQNTVVEINLSGFQSGLYIGRIQGQRNSATFKIVKL
jgi:hypothetical protein